jgi:ABC-2 type transport system permease protein
MWSICKKEFNQFFSNLTGIIAIVLFLLINGIFLFILPESNIFDFGYASLDKFFDLAPWILLFLIPAISMRSFSDEYKSGTFELLKTMPLSAKQITIGKYLSIILVLVCVLLPTIIYVFSIKSLSADNSIDIGGIIGSYVGLFLLGASFAGISICCSSFTSNAVIAFLLSVFVCILIYFGFNALSKLSVFQGGMDYYIEMFGIDFHYRSMSRGVIDTRDLTYFGSFLLLSLFITTKKIQHKQ